jgi:predicted transcriptional regulator
VAEIKRGLQSGETQMALADRYGVSQAVISKIKLGQSWSHVAA